MAVIQDLKPMSPQIYADEADQNIARAEELTQRLLRLRSLESACAAPFDKLRAGSTALFLFFRSFPRAHALG
jgi:hypothetical protein